MPCLKWLSMFFGNSIVFNKVIYCSYAYITSDQISFACFLNSFDHVQKSILYESCDIRTQMKVFG